MLKSILSQLFQTYNSSNYWLEDFWAEIETHYSAQGRYYHNLAHLSDLYEQLVTVKDNIQNWNVILFTLFYHDIIYKSTKSNNEEKSAELAVHRMSQIGVSHEETIACHQQILATKSHQTVIDPDANYFTDADLSILGRDKQTYKSYCAKIRKEYSIYPNFMYKRGRKKVVSHFLSMDRIFKSGEFYNKYEKQARLNLEHELNSL